MSKFGGPKFDLRDFSPAELNNALVCHDVVLVDVREPGEHQAVLIKGAVLRPLASFNPLGLPRGEVVLHCTGGKRSRTAASMCAKAGVKIAGHLEGGIAAWIQAGLPVIRG